MKSQWAHRDAKLNCGCFLALGGLLASAVALWTAWLPGLWAWILLAACAALILIFMVAIHRRSRQVDAYQAARDRRSAELLRELRAGARPEGPFFVYLRPFAFDGAFVDVPRDADYEQTEQFGWAASRHDMESALALLVSRYGDLVALSDEPGRSGAGRVRSSDEGWRDDVRELCEHAAGVFVIPFAYEGTAWEIGMLERRGLLEKALFVMPSPPPFSRGRRYESLWSAGRAEYPSLRLPEYDPRGAIICTKEGRRLELRFGRRLQFSLSGGDREENKRDFQTLRSLIQEMAARSAS